MQYEGTNDPLLNTKCSISMAPKKFSTIESLTMLGKKTLLLQTLVTPDFPFSTSIFCTEHLHQLQNREREETEN